jgi:hypothetical protein
MTHLQADEIFACLERHGVRYVLIGGLAAVEDVIRSKEAANRPKDQRALPILRQLLDEIRRRGGAPQV